MPYEINCCVSFCIVGDRAVFLDLRSDRYLSAPAELGRRVVEFGASAINRLGVDQLVERGILLSTEGLGAVVEVPFQHASQSIFDAAIPGVSALAALDALARDTVFEMALRKQPIRSLVGQLRQKKQGVQRRECESKTRSIAASYRAADYIRSGNNRCLARSLALLNHLLERGCCSELVIGVRTTPFRAHCWVQHHEVVLTDTVDRVRQYSPVLVV